MRDPWLTVLTMEKKTLAGILLTLADLRDAVTASSEAGADYVATELQSSMDELLHLYGTWPEGPEMQDDDPTPWEAPVGPGPANDPMPWNGR